MSGGVIRELIRSFRDAATSAQLLKKTVIDETIAQDVINKRRQDIELRLKAPHRRALQAILKEGMLKDADQELMEDELLRSLHLLSYQDDEDSSWFDVHPIVLPLL